MSNNNHQSVIELQKQSTELFSKISFMLITASAASIGFILTQISAPWSDLLWLAILSLFLFGLSFLCGFHSLNNTVSQLNLNSKFIQFFRNKDYTAWGDFVDELEKVLPVVNRYRTAQTYTFISGAITYALYVFLKAYLPN